MTLSYRRAIDLFLSLPFLTMLLVILVAAQVVLLIVLHNQALHQVAGPLPDTTENIHLGLAGDGKVTPEEMNAVDYDWGANYPHIWGLEIDPPHMDKVHKSFYFPFDRAGGYPDDITFPLYFDEQWFLSNHPDWLVYRCDKTSLAYEFHDPNVPLDITNPNVLQFMLNIWLYPALYRGFDGIGFDNVNLTNEHDRCGVWKTLPNGKHVWSYLYGGPDTLHGQAYVTSVLSWAKFMYLAIHTYKRGATVEMNFSPINGGNPSQGVAFNEQLIPFIDVDIDESGFTNDAQRPPMSTDITWQVEFAFSQALAGQGKGQLLIMAYPEPDLSHISRQERQWTLANYLLVKGIHTYLFLSSKPDTAGSSYGYLNNIPEYAVKIGHAISEMYQFQSVYMRNYSHGLTIVNSSSSHTYTIMLPANTYKDLYGYLVPATITMPPHTGLVLVRNAQLQP